MLLPYKLIKCITMNKYILTIALAVLTSCASIDDKDSIPNYKKAVIDESIYTELDQLYLKENISGVFEKFQSISNPNTLLSASYWLRDISKKSGDSRYMYLYATTLLRLLDIKNIDSESKEEFKETAVLVYYLARLTLLIDGIKCKDQTIDFGTIMRDMEIKIDAKIFAIYNAFPQEQKKHVESLVLKTEEQIKNIRTQKWICQKSISYLTDKKKLQYVSDKEYQEWRLKLRRNFLNIFHLIVYKKP